MTIDEIHNRAALGFIIIIFGCMLMGCSGKTSYTIKSTYVNSITDKEVRTMEVNLDQTSYWKNAILVDFPRTIKLMNEEYIWRFKK